MTSTQIIVIIVAVFLFRIALNIGNGYYWKSKFETLAKLLNTTVEYSFPVPLYMKIKGRYKNREVQFPDPLLSELP